MRLGVKPGHVIYLVRLSDNNALAQASSAAMNTQNRPRAAHSWSSGSAPYDGQDTRQRAKTDTAASSRGITSEQLKAAHEKERLNLDDDDPNDPLAGMMNNPLMKVHTVAGMRHTPLMRKVMRAPWIECAWARTRDLLPTDSYT